MPETTVDENYRPIHRKDKIRFSRKLRIVNTIAKAGCVKAPPKDQLWLCVLATNPRHHPRAGFLTAATSPVTRAKA